MHPEVVNSLAKETRGNDGSTLVKRISLGRNCLSMVSNLVRQISSVKALRLNSEVELSNTHIPNVSSSPFPLPSRIEMQ